MTFLELVARTWRKCGLSGDPPVAVTNQQDMAARVVMWVEDAYAYIQQQHPDWRFLWTRVEGNLATGQSAYYLSDLGISDCRRLDRIALLSNWYYSPVEWAGTAGDIEDFDNPGAGPPTRYMRLPNGQVQFDNAPTEDSPIRVEYYRTAHVFASSADTPLIPTEFQQAIVFKAQEYYAVYDEDQAMAAEAAKEYGAALHRLMREQLDPVHFPPSSFLS